MVIDVTFGILVLVPFKIIEYKLLQFINRSGIKLIGTSADQHHPLQSFVPFDHDLHCSLFIQYLFDYIFSIYFSIYVKQRWTSPSKIYIVDIMYIKYTFDFETNFYFML
jgi:hypothetical protein